MYVYAKNKSIEDYDDAVFNNEFHNIEAERHFIHRKQAERKYLLRRRIEDLREEKELREQDLF